MATRFLDLQQEYEDLWGSMAIRSERLPAVQAIVDRIVLQQGRYRAVERDSGVPWRLVAVIHSLEASLSFRTHLHNGDPLSARTVHVPAGRPLTGQPPFSWEESAVDALRMKETDQISGFTVPEMLWYLERYNGFGYRGSGRGTTPPMRSPYLWSFTNHYSKGKYIADGHFDPNAISLQAGGAALLFQLQHEEIHTQQPISGGVTPVDLDHNLFLGSRGQQVAQLQIRLRELGLDVGDIDGQFGRRTLAAVLAFQSRAGLIADGVVGPATWRALSQSLQAPAPVNSGERMSELRQRVLAVAAQEAAKQRSHSPGNELDRMVLDPLRPAMVRLGHLGAGQTDSFFNWCAAWVTAICRKADINIPDIYADFWATVALVESWRDMGRRTGSWTRRGSGTPKPGDIITFDWDGDQILDHIGIFKGFSPDGTLLTLEGNNHNREGEFHRALTHMDGFLDLDRLAAALHAVTA